MGGYLYPLSQKLAVGRAVPGNSGYMSGSGVSRTKLVLLIGNSNPDTPGIRPDTPDILSGHSGRVPDIPGWTLNFTFKSLLSVEMVSYDFCGFS
jgi:hypothetical protein